MLTERLPASVLRAKAWASLRLLLLAAERCMPLLPKFLGWASCDRGFDIQ